MTDNDIHQVQLKVSELNVIVEMLETSITKLVDVSQTLEKNAIRNTTKVDTFEKQVEVIHERITDFKKEILKELKELHLENSNQHLSFSKRIERLESWRWFVIGISVCLGFIAANAGKVMMLFK